MTRSDTSQLQRGLFALRCELRRRARRLALVRGLWALVAGVLLLVALDAMFGFCAAARAAGDLALAVAVAIVMREAHRRVTASPSPDRMVARLAEAAYPDCDNRLINAVDFGEATSGTVAGGTTARLMQREIEAAAARAADIRETSFLRPPTLRLEVRVLCGLLAAAALAAVAAPRVFRATLPRLLLPGADYPPYSPTTLTLEPLRATVTYGEGLNITAQAGGRRPPPVTLVLETPRGRPVAELPMYEVREGTHVQTLEAVTEDLRYFARIPGGRSRKGRVEVVKIPRIETVRVRYDYPAYTRLRPQERYLADGRVRAFRGTRVTFRLTSNRPLGGGTLQAGDRAIPLQRTAETNTVAATVEVTIDQAFTASVRDVDGLWSRDRTQGRIEVTPDEKPEVTIVNPPRMSFATPDAEVPVNIEARDDLGIATVCIVRNLNESADFRKTVHDAHGERTFVNVVETLALADLGVKPGDVIDYYVTATDNCPGAPNTAASEAGRLSIVSEAQYAAYVRTRMTAEQLRESYDRLMEEIQSLAQQQARLAEDARALQQRLGPGAPTDSDRERLKELQDQQRQLAAATRAAAARLAREASTAPVYDVEHDYKRALEGFSGALGEAAEFMDQGAQQFGEAGDPTAGAQAGARCAGACRAQDEALTRLGRTAQAFGDGIGKAGSEIERLSRLYQDVETFKHLLSRQESIERQSRLFAGRPAADFEDQVRLKELGEEQESVRREVAALRAAFVDHAASVTNEYPKVARDARRIAQQMADLKIESLMAQAVTALNAVRGDEGHARARDALEAMRSMVQTCSAAGGGAQAECEKRLRITMNMELGRTFQQLAQRAGFGTGGAGGVGVGDAGLGGSVSTPFGLYGGSDTLNGTAEKSKGIGRGRAKSTVPDPGLPERTSSTAEVSASRKEGKVLEVTGGENLMEEYRDLIVEYFRRMAEGSK